MRAIQNFRWVYWLNLAIAVGASWLWAWQVGALFLVMALPPNMVLVWLARRWVKKQQVGL